jgi:glycerophosphoryl diester phosphodiesterase
MGLKKKVHMKSYYWIKEYMKNYTKHNLKDIYLTVYRLKEEAVMRIKLFIITFILGIVTCTSIYGVEDLPFKIIVNNNEIKFSENKPFINNNSCIMVSAEDVLFSLEYKVKWDDNLNTIIADNKVINNESMVILDDVVYVSIKSLMRDLDYYVIYNEEENTVEIDTDRKYRKVSFKYEKRKIAMEQYVAHGGGIIDDMFITNSLEALDNSYYNGVRMIEVDFSFTNDGVPVLLHDWGHGKKFFDVYPIPYSYNEFLNELVMCKNLHQLDIQKSMNWLRDHKDAYFITDTKDDNIYLLNYIAINYADVMDRIIPQMYKEDEYNQIRKMGYNNIILTVYKLNSSIKEIVEIVKDKELFAVTMPIERAKAGLGLEVKKYNIPTYCHTINDEEIVTALKHLGIDGVYTDNLYMNN